MSDERLISELRQKKWFGRMQSFRITADRQVTWEVNSPTNVSQSKISLNLLGFEPIRSRRLNLKPLILIVPLALGIFFLILAGFIQQSESQPDSEQGCFSAATILACLIVPLICWIPLQSFDVLIFPSRRGGAGLSLWFNNPTPDEFNVFKKTLSDAIREAQISDPPPDSSLAGEIERLKSQMDRGILTPEQFESAKNKLLGGEPPKRMGF